MKYTLPLTQKSSVSRRFHICVAPSQQMYMILYLFDRINLRWLTTLKIVPQINSISRIWKKKSWIRFICQIGEKITVLDKK